MSTLAAAKARYQAIADDARRFAAVNLSPRIGIQFHITGWTNKGRQAYSDQWCTGQQHDDGGWDWEQVFAAYRKQADRLEMVVWSPEDRLSVLAVATCSDAALNVQFVEGDFRNDCPLKGFRFLIVFECAQAYAQGRGRSEVRLTPINEDLEALYRDKHGFTLVKPRKGSAYYVRQV